MESRQNELSWVVKCEDNIWLFFLLTDFTDYAIATPIARINSVFFYFAFTCAPILVSVFAFLAFIWSGHEMTISIAFTVCRSSSNDFSMTDDDVRSSQSLYLTWSGAYEILVYFRCLTNYLENP